MRPLCVVKVPVADEDPAVYAMLAMLVRYRVAFA